MTRTSYRISLGFPTATKQVN